MNEQAITSPSQVTIYNPNEIINLFSESLSRRGPGIVNVRGNLRKLARESLRLQAGDESARIRFHNSVEFSIFELC